MSDVISAQPQSAAQTESRTSAHGSFIWYELITPDPKGAKKFYDAVIGWDIEPEPMPGPVEYRMIRRSDGGNAGGVLRLTDDMASHGAKPIWLGYVAVDDVDGTVAQIEAKGGRALMPASDIPGVGRIAMVADPQGAPIYVMKPTPPAGNEDKVSDVFSPDAVGRCSWNELSTSDPAAALEFYTSLFGWKKGDVMPMGEAGDYRFINHGGQMIGAIFPTTAGAFRDELPHWRYYFRVPSIPAAKAAAEQGGGTITIGPMEVPGGNHIVIGKDPQSAEFALVGKA